MATPQSKSTRSRASGRTGAEAVARLDPRDESGQAIVEAALVLPAMIFLILMILQLTMLQHARIMTEYAAFAAARAGIVLSADKNAMRRAAELALMPTITRVGPANGGDAQAAFNNAIGAIEREKTERNAVGVPLLNLLVLSPCLRNDDAGGIDWGFGSEHLREPAKAATSQRIERDFDDIREDVRTKNILKVGIQYNYRMTIPFANRMLQAIYFAGRTRTLGTWTGSNWLAPTVNGQAGGAVQAAQRAAGADPRSAAVVGPALNQNVNAQRFYFPLFGTHAMRMQSNLPLHMPTNPRECLEDQPWPP